MPIPTGTITADSILIDVQGTADISNITVNGVAQVVLVGPPTSKDQCKKGGWKRFNNPSFKQPGAVRQLCRAPLQSRARPSPSTA